ncbi:basic helix-loop-helix domain-containing protein USF3 [Narcine bancroftii]|uniref:basic helix-loop-helix domain-containing protein USF3 n=1 Tax=Narcine bancroftii TaxID=1343680 RepID=UPI003830FEDC
MPEMTENQTPLRRTHRKKNRETHNAVERHRKKKINSGINKIGELIPCSPALKQSKNMILDQAYKYISELKRQNDEILLNGGTKEQGEEIVRLRRQLDDLQKENDRFMELLKANDICLHDDPTIHWKRKFKSTKVTMISPNQTQDDVLMYTNGNQLNGNCQQATVQRSPELILNTLKNTAQETCLDIMMPMALPDIGPVANGVPLQTPISQQEIPECLPAAETSLNPTSCTTTTMSTVQSMLNVSINSSGPVLLQCPLSSCASTPAACPTSTSAQIVMECSQARIRQSISEAAGGCPMPNVPGVSSSTCLALPLHLQQMGTMCTGMECPSGMTQEITSSQSSESKSARCPTSQSLQNVMAVSACQNLPMLARSLPPTFEAGTMYNSSLMLSGPAASSWTVPCPLSTKACSSDLSNLGALTCMTFAGNTRTTWTTLQLAGNTVHPVSQVSCSVLPTMLSENVNSRNSLSTSDAGQPVNHLAAVPSASRVPCSAYRQLSQQLPVGLQTSTHPHPLQPILAQPCVPAPPAAKVVSLIPPLQVIQMGHPSGTADPSSPNSQKLIILQPANPSSSGVVRGAVNSQAQGQQIVIIQAASQNAVSVVSAQASSRAAPTLDAGQGACSVVPSAQMVGGKHLVHILPRPVPPPVSSWQTATHQQQTISVNGQLFALQPVKQGGGMHIIQPTTSADPNTNVALNTFGALTSLSQSVSKMAVPRALPLECSQTTSPSTSSGQVIRTPSTTVSSPNCTGQSCASHTSNLLPLKPPHLAPLTPKPKKTQKKLSSKQGLSRKATGPGHKPRSATTCSHSARTNQGSPYQLLSAEQVSPADGLLASQHSSLSQLPSAVTTATESPEKTAPKLPAGAPAPPASEAAPLCPESLAEANETPAPSAASTASLPRVNLVGDEASIPIAVPQGPGEAETGKDSVSEGLPEEPAPCATPGIPRVSQQLESLAAAQRQVCAEASKWTEGKTGGQGTAVLPESPGQSQPEARPSSGESELCPPEPEATPLSAQRQTESPMSTSSASSRGFSVASLLPDSTRQDGAFNACGLTEHGDIVALAARAIFEQESPGKGASPETAGCDAGTKYQKTPCGEKEPCPSLQPDTGPGVEGGSANVQEAVTNLAPDQGLATVSGRSSARERTSATLVCPPLPTTTPAVINQGHGCQLAADLPSASTTFQEQAGLSGDFPTMVEPQNGLTLKPNSDVRKDATKRNGPADHLISTAKRQKQCLDGKPAVASTLPDHQCERDRPFTSSSSLAPAASAGHSESLGALFAPANFLGPGPVDTLRVAEAHCGGPTRFQEPATPLMQQHGMAQTNGVPLAHGHSYYKHPQGQLRERQLQHQMPHVEGPAPAQGPGAPQSRTAQQDAQLQKKRGLVRAGQAPSLPLQHKQHPAGGGQARHKGGQQLLQQQPLPHPHFGNVHPEKRCESSAAGRNHLTQGLHGPDLLHQDNGRSGQGPGVSSEQMGGHARIQRLLTSRSLEQQMVSKASSVSRPSDMQCAPHRQERNRISSYSAEALIGKSSSAESRMALQSPRASLEQSELRTYLDLSMNKPLSVHGLQPKLPLDHCMTTDVSALPDCPPFKAGVSAPPVGNFDVQSSRGSEMTHRGIQGHGFRFAQGAGVDRQARLPYLPMQGMSTAGGASLRDNEGSCHQTFMQSLLPPPLGEQLGGGQRPGPEHARSSQCAPGASIEYPCAPVREAVHIRRDGEVQSRDNCELSLGALGPRSISYPNPSSVPDIQSRNGSPNVAAAQKAPLRMNESQGNKCHGNSHISNMHGGVRPVLAHGAERGHTLQHSSTVGQRARHPTQPSKLRQSERARSGSHRSVEASERSLQLPLSTGGGMILARQQVSTTRTSSIVRFGADSQQVPNENLPTEQHSLSQSFGFPFIAEGTMNPPLNANTPFIPPVTQPGTNRTPTLLPVEPQNPLPSFYPPYSPAHPNLSNDLSIPYFSNQIFTSPSTEKASNPFGSILSPPRPVGFPQPSFPLLPDIPTRPMANSSSITPHLSNFNLTALFPEIAAAPLTADTPGMPMSPLLPLTNPALNEVSKQHSNRSAHNISHILGHDGSSAV